MHVLYVLLLRSTLAVHLLSFDSKLASSFVILEVRVNSSFCHPGNLTQCIGRDQFHELFLVYLVRQKTKYLVKIISVLIQVHDLAQRHHFAHNMDLCMYYMQHTCRYTWHLQSVIYFRSLEWITHLWINFLQTLWFINHGTINSALALELRKTKYTTYCI